jgi:hypothetical protein
MWSNSRMPTLPKRCTFATYLSGPAARDVLLCALALLSAPAALHAQGFSAVVSPPRFEINVQPGKLSRQIIEITHVANNRGNYRVYTNDWSLAADGNAVFSDQLAANSCRPWVALERRELSLAGNTKIRFRFEITPPADAPSGECRFAIMIEGLEQVIKTEGPVSFPVSGRVGIVVYAMVGDARPKLEISHAGTGQSGGIEVPQVQVRNGGNAHGRLGGFLNGVDSQGRSIDFIPEGLPILPAQTRTIALIPYTTGSDAVTPSYPIQVKGNLEWGDQKTPIDYRFDAPVPVTPRVVAPPKDAKAKLAPAGNGAK